MEAVMVVVLLALTSPMAEVRVAMVMEKKKVVLVVPMMAELARMVIMMDPGVVAARVGAGRMTPRALGR